MCRSQSGVSLKRSEKCDCIASNARSANRMVVSAQLLDHCRDTITTDVKKEGTVAVEESSVVGFQGRLLGEEGGRGDDVYIWMKKGSDKIKGL